VEKLNILYASNSLSDKEFEKLFDQCRIKPLQSIQKFNKLLCKGLISNNKVNLDIITSMPINRNMCGKILWNSKKENVDGINYNYCFMLNLPIIKFITLFFSSTVTSVKWCLKNKKDKENVVIYDAFCPIIGNCSAIIGKIFKCKIIALYTDLPICMGGNLTKNNNLKSIMRKIYNSIDFLSNNLSDGYIVLTKEMNKIINKNNKPYIVMEGIVDKNINVDNSIESKYDEFAILYAGGLYEKFGIINLIEAIELIQNIKVKLFLYGEGELSNLLKTKYKNTHKIYYGGVIPNNEIVECETKCSLLINPRFTNEEYTKYSFPSKNMEYMASGTPVLTTRLSGMPDEYNQYVYFIDDESILGIKKKIEELINLGKQELYDKGMNARKFVMKNKNNYIQADRIVNFIDKI
jgi:glycosyltransferase involved in cell wall biosynthesis